MSAVVNGGQRDAVAPPVDPAAPADSGPRPPVRHVVAIPGGLAAAVVGYAVVATEVLPGVVTGLLVGLLAVALPVSESLSRRIALVGTVLLGWTPALWWFRWPVSVNHGALLTGLVAGLLAGWLVLAPGARDRVLPRWRAVDAVPLLVGLLTCGLMTRWLVVDTPRKALNLLLPGWDNVAHFSMFEMLRRTGVMADQLGPAPDGTAWHYAPYPQGFHSVVATVADLFGLQGASGGAASLSAYTLSVGVIVVLSMVVLTAALCSLSPLRRRPAVAVPVVAFVVGAFLVGPGGSTIADGFAPFWYACALVAIGVVLSLTWVRPAMPLLLAAVGGAMAGVAQAWAPMCLLLAPAFLCALLPLRRTRWRASRSSWLLSTVLALLMVVAVGRPALRLVRTVGVGDVVTASGGFSPPDPTRLLLLTVAAVVGACAFPLLRRRTAGAGPMVRRASWLGLVVALAMVSAGILLIAQVSRNGRPDYYFFKYVVGLELVVVTVLVTGAGLLIATRLAPRTPNRVKWAAAVVVVLVPLLVSPSSARSALWDPRRSVTVEYPPGASRDALARTILGASTIAPRAPGEAVLLALPPGRADQAFFSQQWLMALSGTWTDGADRVSAPLLTSVRDASEAARVARRVLSRHDRTVVLVPEADMDAIRSALGDQTMASRVRTWDDRRR